MNEIILLEGVHHELIWGTEDWIISAHNNGDNIVKGTDLKLSEYFAKFPEKFGSTKLEKFPLLIKIIDAKTDLSVQVHPNDEYAAKNENSLGKTECWYILGADADSDIIVGQTASDRVELADAIAGDKLMDKLNVMKVEKNDFFYIPAGTVHAIRSNTKILEVQQSSDVTYRLFDYNRVDATGNVRETHVEKSLDVIDYDYKYEGNDFKCSIVDGNHQTILIDSEFFKVEKYDIAGELKLNINKCILGVSFDQLIVNGQEVKPLESFIIPIDSELKVEGIGSVCLSTY